MKISPEFRMFALLVLGLMVAGTRVSAQNLLALSGLNVTIPHKIKAKEYIERKGTLDENAKRLGAVNTIKIAEDGTLCGYNTDGPGFYRSLVEDLKFEPEGRNVFVL